MSKDKTTEGAKSEKPSDKKKKQDAPRVPLTHNPFAAAFEKKGKQK